MSSFQKAQATLLANEILRSNDSTLWGRPKDEVDPAQCAFERRFIVNPVGNAR